VCTEVGPGLRDIVLDGDPAPPHLKGHSPQFSANVRCGQTAGWTKMLLGMEVGLGPGEKIGLGPVDFVFDGDPATRRKKAHPPPPNFGPCPLWPNGWMDEDDTWYGKRHRPRPHCIRRGPSSLRKGHSSLPSFWSMSIVATVAHLSYC